MLKCGVQSPILMVNLISGPYRLDRSRQDTLGINTEQRRVFGLNRH